MAETTLYQLASQGPQQMMSYILRTKSGKLAVIDGGNHLDTDYLLEFLHSISQGKPVVEAWFLTHAHSDHVDAFLDIQREHAGEVDIRHVYYRFPDEGFIAAYEPGDVHTIREWNDLLPRFERLCVPVEEGQRIQVEELLFEVLYIPDPAFTTNAINNSSIVLRLTVDGQRVLFLSDLGVEAGEKLLASYGPEGVRATICQMAHHGQAGSGENAVCCHSTQNLPVVYAAVAVGQRRGPGLQHPYLADGYCARLDGGIGRTAPHRRQRRHAEPDASCCILNR